MTGVPGTDSPSLGTVEIAPESPSKEARLAEAAMALLGCRSEEDVYEVVREFMSALCPDAVVVLNETSPDLEWLITRHLFGLDDTVLVKAARLVGFDPIGKRSAISPLHREALLSGTLAKIPGGYVELASLEVPRLVAQLSAEIFGLRDAFSIGISDGSSVLGNIQLYTRASCVEVPTAIVEAFAHHCYSTLASIGAVRKLAESAKRIESLLDRERLLQLFFDRNPDGVVVLDPESGRALHFNDAAHRQLGFTREEFAELSVSDLEAGSVTSNMHEHIERVMQEGRADFETQYRTKSDEVRDVRVTARRIDTPHESVYFSVFRDITEQKDAERASKEQADRVELLLDSTVEGILGFDLDGRITFCNAASVEMLGYEREDELLGEVGHELFHYQHADGAPYPAQDCPIRQALRSGDSVHRADEVFWLTDGSCIPVEYWSRPMLKDGEMIGSELSFVDVTERERALVEIADALEFTQAVLGTSPTGIIVFNGTGQTVMANDAAARILGIDSSALLARDFRQVELWNRPDVLDAAESALSEGTHPKVEVAGSTLDGKEANLNVQFAPFERAGGRHLLMNFSDVTEIKTAEQVIMRANQRLEGVLKGVIETLGRVVETRDPYTKGHEQRSARIAKQIALEMGLSDEEADRVEVAGLVHDVGKLGVPAEILTKPGRISSSEFKLIQEHSQAGYDILKEVDFDWPLAQIVLQHHERMDGSGYPNGLRGDDILMAARILMVADVIEAMASHRPYRAALGIDAAMTEIASHPEKFDADVVSACMRLYDAGRIEV